MKYFEDPFELHKWFDDSVIIRNRVLTADVFDENDTPSKVVIPCDYYPLNDKLEVFNCTNCPDEVKDPDILNIFNVIPYKLGHCYQNTKNLTNVLNELGFKAIAYAGWLFVGPEPPVHHAWVILRKTSHRYLLDLSDEFSSMFENGDQIDTEDELIDYFKWSAQLPNHTRCRPVGIPTYNLLYAGCPCDPDDAKLMWNKLIERYPDHKSWHKNELGDDPRLSNIQVKLKNNGLM